MTVCPSKEAASLKHNKAIKTIAFICSTVASNEEHRQSQVDCTIQYGRWGDLDEFTPKQRWGNVSILDWLC